MRTHHDNAYGHNMKENRRRMNIGFETCLIRKYVAAIPSALFALLVTGYPHAALAQRSGQRTFPSAEEAVGALIVAVQNNDERAMTKILGAGKELTSLDDEVQDKGDRQLFIEKYQEMHRLVREPDGTTVLYTGAENWPFPAPLVSKNGAWYFDSTAGAEEVLFRRIGENEGEAIYISHALVRAVRQQKTEPGGDITLSKYLDPLPFHGYYFRILTRQGKSAPGGGKSSITDGKMAAGSAFVAYPADYRSSGVMTFIVNQDDVVYEKDLGPSTAKLARAMTEYAPDSTWDAAE